MKPSSKKRQIQFNLVTTCNLCGQEDYQYNIDPKLLTEEEIKSEWGDWRQIKREKDHEDLKDCIRHLRKELATHEHGRAK